MPGGAQRGLTGGAGVPRASGRVNKTQCRVSPDENRVRTTKRTETEGFAQPRSHHESCTGSCISLQGSSRSDCPSFPGCPSAPCQGLDFRAAFQSALLWLRPHVSLPKRGIPHLPAALQGPSEGPSPNEAGTPLQQPHQSHRVLLQAPG